MANIFLTWAYRTLSASFLVAIAVILCLCANFGAPLWVVALSFFICFPVVFLIYRTLSRTTLAKVVRTTVAEDAEQLSGFIDTLSPARIAVGIVISAAASLLLELSVIRWQASIFLLFSYYKNFSLISCFAGLGLGYALSSRKQIPLSLVPPLIALRVLFLSILRYSFGRTLTIVLDTMPTTEQTNLFMTDSHSLAQYGVIYFFLAVVFVLTALTFLPVGQLCGALMQRQKPLPAYGLNLLGSLLGVCLSFILSFLWTPPAIWFAVAFAMLIVFLVYSGRSVLIAGLGSLLAITALSWPNNFLAEIVYTPYQEIERTCNYRGWMMINCAGQYYQRINDLSPLSVQAFPELKSGALSYDLPFAAFQRHPSDVAIMAAGAGNDVAAALRAGADHIDAVEIDPAILEFGKRYHPEHPYASPKVTAVLDDARAFLRTSHKQYDLIIFSALDSHTVLSHASNLRLDSYVYTIESFRDARAHLKPGGVLSISFDSGNPKILAKIRLMMEKTFDGKPPACIQVKAGACTFIQTKEGNIKYPDTLVQNEYLHDATAEILKEGTDIDVSTDDWPFLYMFKRVYPFSYIGMFALVTLLTYLLGKSFGWMKPGTTNNYWSFSLLGAGFMLVETKAITELSLAFSNTWYVVGFVIASIMIMAFLANLVVSLFKMQRAFLPYCLLLLSLAFGFYVAHSGWLPANSTDKILQIIILTMPVFFSGMVFSILIGGVSDIAPAMAMNLMGAMVGAILEYNAMYFGYKALYLIAIVVYGAAFCLLRFHNRNTSAQAPETTTA